VISFSYLRFSLTRFGLEWNIDENEESSLINRGRNVDLGQGDVMGELGQGRYVGDLAEEFGAV
jgi:hypothetical protein